MSLQKVGACAVEGCERAVRARGWCALHYMRWQRQGGAAVTKPRRTHGLSHSPLYRVWTSMIQRCHNVKEAAYPNYGGRGIAVCERWRTSFANFIADVGERPAGMTLDRIDNDGNYEPGNWRWATRKEQESNKRVRKTCRAGHEYRPESTFYYLRDGIQQRICRICANARKRLSTARLASQRRQAMGTDQCR